ncbi:MAG: helix-turn-helix transcriptional regulator [Ktedonobacteraceae bacterium]
MGRKDKPIPLSDGHMLPIGARLRKARQAKGISISEMARTLNYSKSYLSEVENNHGRPSQALLQQYQQALGLKISDLDQAAFYDEDRVEEAYIVCIERQGES